MLLLHGYIGDAADWDMQRTVMADRFRLIVPDLPGHGATRAPGGMEGWTIQGIAADVAALLRFLSLQSACVVGHSLGGFVALELALGWPALVGGLVLVDTHPQPKSTASRAFFERCFAVARKDGMPGIARLLGDQRSTKDADDAGRRRLLDMSVDGYIGAGMAQASWEGVVDRLAEIRVPTLVVVGENDGPAYQEGGKLLERAIAGARLVTIPGAAHAPHRETPEEFTGLVLAFLDR